MEARPAAPGGLLFVGAAPGQEMLMSKKSGRKEKSKEAPALTRLVSCNPEPQFLGDPAEFQAHFDAARSEAVHAMLHKIPAPRRSPPVMTLEEVIGPEDVVKVRGCGRIVFHVVGDTGKGKHSPQSEVIDLMRADYDPSRPPADQPAFLLTWATWSTERTKKTFIGINFIGPITSTPAASSPCPATTTAKSTRIPILNR
jgi:hypothetical protein